MQQGASNMTIITPKIGALVDVDNPPALIPFNPTERNMPDLAPRISDTQIRFYVSSSDWYKNIELDQIQSSMYCLQHLS